MNDYSEGSDYQYGGQASYGDENYGGDFQMHYEDSSDEHVDTQEYRQLEGDETFSTDDNYNSSDEAE